MDKGPKPGLRFLVLLAVVAAVPRALLLWRSGTDYDIHSYLLVEAVLHAGRGLYNTPVLRGRYPYPPAWAWVLRGLGMLGRATGASPTILLKLPGLLAEVGILGLMLGWKSADGRSLPAIERRAAALAYALSPVSWLVTAGHGQFDAVVLFFILGSARSWGAPGCARAYGWVPRSVSNNGRSICCPCSG